MEEFVEEVIEENEDELVFGITDDEELEDETD